MKLFKSKSESFETNIDKETVLNAMKQKGAIVISDSFGFLGNAGGISGYVETKDNITKIYLKPEMSGGVQIFSVFWIIGTASGLIYGVYKIFIEKSFNWLPIISLGLLIFGVLIMSLLSSDQSEQIKSEIKRDFKIRKKVRYTTKNKNH